MTDLHPDFDRLTNQYWEVWGGPNEMDTPLWFFVLPFFFYILLKGISRWWRRRSV